MFRVAISLLAIAIARASDLEATCAPGQQCTGGEEDDIGMLQKSTNMETAGRTTTETRMTDGAADATLNQEAKKHGEQAKVSTACTGGGGVCAQDSDCCSDVPHCHTTQPFMKVCQPYR